MHGGAWRCRSGPNYNDPEPDMKREKMAWDAIQRPAPWRHNTEPERGYIEASPPGTPANPSPI